MSVLSGNDQKDRFSYARVTTDGELYISDPDLAIARGYIPDTEAIFILGRNPDLGMDLEEDIISEGGTRVLLTAAEKMSVVSDNAADAAAGTGAQSVVLNGLDNNFVEFSEVVVLNGLTPVSSVNDFLRINTMTIAGVGSTRTNTGTITVTDQSANIQSCIDPTIGVDKSGIFTIPAGKVFIPRRVELNAGKLDAGGTPLIQFQARLRFNDPAGGPDIQGFDAIMDTATQNNVVSVFPNPTALTEKADIILRATSDSMETEIRVRVFGLLAPL